MHLGFSPFPVDNSAILYLALLRPTHSNIYRFTAILSEPVCPNALQKAADHICPRFPTIIAGFRPGFFSYSVVPAAHPPVVTKDPGLLPTMRKEEVHRCAYRILYSGCEIAIEAFHALTDGYGAVLSLRTLVAEYLFLRYGVHSMERTEILENGEPDWQEELRDAYLAHDKVTPGSVPNRYAYQLPAQDRNWNVKASSESFDATKLLRAAKSCGVSLTAFLSCIVAESIMELQQQKASSRKSLPVRIMVPVDLRKLFPCKTVRNFILYTLPTLEQEQADLPRCDRMKLFQQQLKEQVTPEYLLPQVSRNVRIQNSWFFRHIPRTVKCLSMRIAYHFGGERNSSITLTNLGTVSFSEPLQPYIRGIDIALTPRRNSPYNCGLISYGNTIRISFSRFGAQPELETLFFQKLYSTIE